MNAFKRFLCLMLAFVMVPVSPLMAQEGEAGTDHVIDVTDFGADRYGTGDTIQAVEDALAAAALLDGHKTVRFPKGRYDFYPDHAPQRELYVSNTTGANQSVKMKKIGILVENMQNLTIDGDGSLFMFHGKMTEFAAIDSENITFKNFTTDFQSPTVVDITVESTEGNSAIAYIPECWNWKIIGKDIKITSDASPYTGKAYWSDTVRGFNYTQIFDIETGKTFRGSKDLMSSVSSIEDLGNNRVKINYNSLPGGVRAGRSFQMRRTLRDHPGTFFWKSRDILLENIDIQYLHGFGMVGQHTENIALHGVRFEAPAQTGRTTAGFADFLQMSGCKGLIDIQDCVFSNPHDDPINVHGTFNTVSEKIASNKIKVTYSHNETAGFPNFFEGDQIEFMTRGSMIPVADSVRTVTKVDGPDGMGGNMGEGSSLTSIILTLDADIPAEVGTDTHVVENITWTPSVNIENCVFKETPTRGILCTTRKPVTIKNNLFDGMGMASIYISNDAQGWYESGPVRDMLIEGNTFRNCSAQAIFIEPTNPSLSSENCVHSNIRIRNNTFHMDGTRVLDAKSVRDLTFENNSILRENALSSFTLNVPETLEAGQSGQASVSLEQNALNSSIFRLAGCKNTLFANNRYDGNINTTISLASTDAGEVTIENDQASTANAMSDASVQIQYVSSDPEVVQVSDSGVLKAKKAGTALIHALASIGGRTWKSGTQQITVAGSEQGIVPSAVHLMAADQSIQTGQSLPIEVFMEAEENADTSLFWSVTDASTGAAAEHASVSADNIFMADKGGLYEVRALCAGGLEASLLINVSESSMALAENFEIAFDDGNSVAPIEGGAAITTRPSGLYQEQTPANVLLGALPLDQDFRLSVKASGHTAENAWGALGLYLYQDQDNYISIERKQRGGNISRIAQVREENRQAAESFAAADNIANESVWLRLDRSGNTISSSYSLNGTDWISVAEADCSFLNGTLKAGLASLCGSGQNPVISFTELTLNGNPVSIFENAAAPVIETAELTAENGRLHIDAGIDSPVLAGYEIQEEDGSFHAVSGLFGNGAKIPAALSGKTIRGFVCAAKDGGTGEAVYTNTLSLGEIEEEPVLLANASLIQAEFEGLASPFAFEAETFNYITSASLENRMVSWQFAAEESANLQILHNGTPVEASGSMELVHGRNVFEARTTAQDGLTTKTWRFVILAAGDGNNSLASLKVNGESLVPGEESDLRLELPAPAKTVSVEAIAAGHNAKTVIFTKAGLAENGEVSLEKGSAITIVVYSETSKEPKVYTVHVTMPDPSDASLAMLSIESGAILSEPFDADADLYQAKANGSKAVVALEAGREQSTIVLKRNGQILAQGTGSLSEELALYEGENLFAITITSQDGTNVLEKTLNITAARTNWLSDLNWSSETSGDASNPTSKDTSTGGNPITLFDGEKEVIFEKGLSSHAASTITYDLKGAQYDTFEAFVGIDRETRAKPSEPDIIFIVKADGQEVFNSGLMTFDDVMKPVSVDVKGVSTLELIMDPGQHNWSDHGDWANAHFTLDVPAAPAEEATDFRLLEMAVEHANALLADNALEGVNSLVRDFFEASLEKAEQILAAGTASQQEVNEAWISLSRAIQMLDFKTDKTELNALIAAAKAIDLSLYQDGAIKDAFAAALENAMNVAGKDDVLTEGSIASAIAALRQAMEDLEQVRIPVQTVDTSLLELLISTAESADLDRYYEEGKPAFAAALVQAKAVLENPESQQIVDEACASLNAAWLNLRLLPDESLLAMIESFKNEIEALDLAAFEKSTADSLNDWLKNAKRILNGTPSAAEAEQIAAEIPALRALIRTASENKGSQESIAESMPKNPESLSVSGRPASAASVKTAASSSLAYYAALGAAALALLGLLKKRL